MFFTQWKTSIILPIPKVTQPASPADFRPISITSTLSRLLERLIVHTFIYRIPSLLLPWLTSSLTSMLSDRSLPPPLPCFTPEDHYLLDRRALCSLDFIKAFDTIRHSPLARKLSLLDIPDAICNFIICFLEDRSHVTRYARRTSEIAHINASIVQGSGFGPSSLDVVVSDLHPLHQANSIVKYADDTYLIVPASARSTVSAELEHISSWASLNNLRLNTSKSKEMVIRRRARRFIPPQSIEGVERVKSMRVLGVVLSEDLRAAK